MHLFTALLVGILFSIGLGIGGMTQPGKVVGFLDVSGDWDPSLAFVMIGAILVYMPGIRVLLKKRKQPFFGARFNLPSRRDITPRLIGGAALFGVGWGLAGYCPGPALATLTTGTVKIAVFAIAMLAGMLLFKVVDGALTRRPSTPAPRTKLESLTDRNARAH